MTLHSCITQATLSLALAASPLTLHTAAQGTPPQAAVGSQTWLGIGIVDLTPEKARQLKVDADQGVEIAVIADGGPAQQAGLQRWDVITHFDDKEVLGAEHLARLVRETPNGRTVELEVWRDGKQREVDVVVQRRGQPTARQVVEQVRLRSSSGGFDFPRAVTVIRNRSLGIEMEGIEDQLARHFGVKQGVLVRSVEAESDAADAGLVAGDVIVSVAGNAVQEPADIRREVYRAASPVEVGIVRNRRAAKVTIAKDESAGGVWPLAGHD